MPNFINGMRVFKPSDKAPDFIKANLVINCKELVEYMRANHTDGQIRVDIKLGKTGNLYAELNTWKKGDVKPKDDWAKPELRQQMTRKDDFDISNAVASTDRGDQFLDKEYPHILDDTSSVDVSKITF